MTTFFEQRALKSQYKEAINHMEGLMRSAPPIMDVYKTGWSDQLNVLKINLHNLTLTMNQSAPEHTFDQIKNVAGCSNQ